MKSVLDMAKKWFHSFELKLREEKFRNEYSKNNIKKKEETVGSFRLSNEQVTQIKNVWGNVFSKLDYRYYEFYNLLPHENLSLYVPDSYFYSKIDTFLSKSRTCIALDNKNFYDLYFSGVNMPCTIIHKMNGVYLDKYYNPISVECALDACVNQEKIIIKPSVNKSGGEGISFWSNKEGVEYLHRLFDSYESCIVQQLVVQHKSLDEIHHESVNSIRIMTLVWDGECSILSSVFRMGVGKSRVDNVSSGGIVCGIDDFGVLKDVAYDGSGRMYTKHPDGGIFGGKQVPGYDKCTSIALNLAYRFVESSKLISWDFAIDFTGEPVLIECNLSFGEVDFHQMCNGPIFKNNISFIKELVENIRTAHRILE